MAWIEFHAGLLRHPKTLYAAAQLHKPRHLVIGHLAELWCWALDSAPNGGPLTAENVKVGAEWPKAAQPFVDALLGPAGDHGFLDIVSEGRYMLHDWDDYAGRLLAQRAANAARMKLARAGATNPTNQPTEHNTTDLTPSSSSSKTPQARPAAALREPIRAFTAATPKERVAKLIELGYALGFERSSVAASVVKVNGHGKPVVDAMLAAAQYADGDPWEYVQGVLQHAKANNRTGSGGRQGASREESGLPTGYEPPTEDELATLARSDTARLAAGGSGGPRDDTQLDHGAVQGQAGEPVQQPGSGGGNG